MKIAFKCHKIVGGRAEGEALISRRTFSFLGGIDPNTGMIVERGHELYGQKLTNKVFIFPHGKGSTAGSYIIYALSKRALGPSAIVNLKAESIIASGAIIGKVPLVDQLEKDPFEIIENGDYVIVDSDNEKIIVTKKNKSKNTLEIRE